VSTESKHVLITGGSGLIGQKLTHVLLKKGYGVSHLSRSKDAKGVRSYHWDLSNGYCDPEAFKETSVVVHLAGAGVADKRWTSKRRKEILDSRVNSTQLLFESIKNSGKVDTFISASAIGYYGFGKPDKIFAESDEPGTDFLAGVTQHWEEEVKKFTTLGIREVRLRTGVVLSDEGGALPKLAQPIKWGVGSPLGSGKQMMSWIHIDDLIGMFVQAIEQTDMHGAYNAVSPNPVSNKEMTKAIAKILKRPLILPAVPGFALKLILGEMSEIILNGSSVSAEKIISKNFNFKFKNLESALADIYKKE